MLKEDFSIKEFADKLRRRSEESKGNAQEDCSSISRDIDARAEALIVEALAKEEGLWIDISEIFTLGTPFPSGVENDVYLNANGNKIYKVNNLMTSKTISVLLKRLEIHNQIFPQTSYSLVGFTGFGSGSVYPVLSQDFVPNEREATPIEIDMYMSAIGFTKIGESEYQKDNLIAFDLKPRNVLRDTDGDIFVIDVDFKEKR